MKYKTTILIVATALALAACGKQQTTTTGASAQQPVAAPQQAQRASDPKGDPSVPLEKYKELTSGKQVLAQYVRLAGVPQDVSQLAALSYEGYASADAFKRKDLEAELRAGMPAMGKQAEADGAYFWLNWNGETGLGDTFETSYDFDKKGFVMADFYRPKQQDRLTSKRQLRIPLAVDGIEYGFRDGPSVFLSNWEDFAFMHVPDEAAARRLEAERDATNRFKSMSERLREAKFTLRVYVFIAAPGTHVGNVRAQIMKLVVVDKKGNIVAQS